MGTTPRKRDSLDLEAALLSIWDASPDEQKEVSADIKALVETVIERAEAWYREGNKGGAFWNPGVVLWAGNRNPRLDTNGNRQGQQRKAPFLGRCFRPASP